jgi:predicted transcriptional regulator
VTVAVQLQTFNSEFPSNCWKMMFMLPHNSKRDRLQIFAEILELCRKPQVKTKVMYKANLSYNMLQDCLMQLHKWKLLEVHHSKKKYLTTEKGQEFLQKWTALQQLITT